MALTENYRVRYMIRKNNGSIVDSGFDLVQTGQHGEMWEPVDTVFANGANGPSKQVTGTMIIAEGDIAGTPLNSNVSYPRTGTAA